MSFFRTRVLMPAATGGAPPRAGPDSRRGRRAWATLAGMDRNPHNDTGAGLSPALLAQAPHRLLFFVGASNVLLAMAWWLLWLLDARWQAIGLPQEPYWGGWMHAFVMQYQLLPPFMFGFLLTVFPRWTGLPE